MKVKRLICAGMKTVGVMLAIAVLIVFLVWLMSVPVLGDIIFAVSGLVIIYIVGNLCWESCG